MQSSDSTLTAPPPPVNLSEKDIARFWSKVDKNGPTMPHMETPCWIWKAGKNSRGYGQISVGGKMLTTHRVAWTITNGPIPRGEGYHGTCVCHRCDVPTCCRPDHYFLGAHADNVSDRASKGRNKPAAGEVNGNAKLTATKVIEIRALYAAGGTTLKRLAAQFGVNFPIIGKIINRKAWSHI